MSKWWMAPVPGKAYKAFKNEFIILDKDELPKYSFQRISIWKPNKKERARIFSLFLGPVGLVLQSHAHLAHIRCRPGEDNINAKLTNEQGIHVYEKINAGENVKNVAKTYDISSNYAKNIANLKTRTHITMAHLNGDPIQKTDGITAKASKGRRCSAKIAQLIRADKSRTNLTMQQLADKYCLHRTTISRILNGKLYPQP